ELATRRVPVFAPWSAFSPNGNLVALVWEKKLHVFDIVSERELPGFWADENFDSYAPAFSADGRRVVAAGLPKGQYIVKVCEIATGKVIATLKAKDTVGEVTGVALSPDGELAAATDRQGKLFVWEVASGKPRFEIVAHV